jgi:hypothetical protein
MPFDLFFDEADYAECLHGGSKSTGRQIFAQDVVKVVFPSADRPAIVCSVPSVHNAFREAFASHEGGGKVQYGLFNQKEFAQAVIEAAKRRTTFVELRRSEIGQPQQAKPDMVACRSLV